ncbi:MAG: hypothetical protein COA57_12230 [Flavobacteriales bacterium]|nr:MAG: hypothetical protein COA57_12230 [Flavobacteriales bacterium]
MKTGFTLLSILVSIIASSQTAITLDSIFDGSGYTYIASPIGTGPFPIVLYNHGGLGTVVGGDLRGTCVALAEAGYLARAEKRMETVPMAGHLTEVETALDDLLTDPRSDTNCVSIIGFSRGGLLTLQAGISQASKVHAIVSMAPASANGQLESMLADVSAIADPVLMLVANNDTFQDNHVMLAQMVYDSLIAAGKTATLTTYPDYDANGDSIIDASDDGHELFFTVQDPYWGDVINFLNANCNSTSSGLIKKEQEKIIVNIYPNPAENTFTISTKNFKINDVTLSIYNIVGIKMMEIPDMKSEMIINRDEMPSGIYLICLKADDSTIEISKLILK